MSRLTWEDQEYETGISRGVFYPNDGPGVPWNGLTSVVETNLGSELTSHYLDGVKFLEIVGGGDYQAAITAFSAPGKFLPYMGKKRVIPGFVLDKQPKPRFHLAYRTEMSDGYRVHLIYNASARLTAAGYSSLSEKVEPTAFTWTIDAVPIIVPGFRPSAHLIVESALTPISIMDELEGILYGSSGSDAEFPTVSELMAIFASGG